MQHTIIGICGPKYSGKDTAAATLARAHKYQMVAFASFLKDACRAIFMLSHDQLHGDKKEVVDERWGVSPRQILQRVGTDLFREQLHKVLPELNLGADKSLWCRCMRMWIDTFKTPQRIVITDVRFKDEEELVRSLGGKILRIERAARPGSGDTHASEVEQTQIVADYTIHNDGTLQDLAREVTRVANLVSPSLSSLLHMPVRGLKLNKMPTTMEELEAGEVVISEPKTKRPRQESTV